MIFFTVSVYDAGLHWTCPPRRIYLKWADWFAVGGETEECARVPDDLADRIEQATANGDESDVKFLRRISKAIRSLSPATGEK